jgi:membrane protease YdiL (CAAX protease family)
MRTRWKQAGLILLGLLALVIARFGWSYFAFEMGNRSPFLDFVPAALIMLAVYVAATRWIEQRPATELSPRRALPVLAAGIAGGIAMFALVMAILWLAGAYHPSGWSGLTEPAIGFVFWLAIGISEELLYRGMLFRLCSKILGTWGAMLVSAAFFGFTHASNQGATVIGIGSVALAGVFLAAAYVATGRLWLPIGLHAGWNFAEGSLFGTAVSGNTLGSPLLTGTISGPDILTGGAFGPEASIVAVLVVLAVTIFLLWQIVRLRRGEPPIWSKQQPLPTATPVGESSVS